MGVQKSVWKRGWIYQYKVDDINSTTIYTEYDENPLSAIEVANRFGYNAILISVTYDIYKER